MSTIILNNGEDVVKSFQKMNKIETKVQVVSLKSCGSTKQNISDKSIENNSKFVVDMWD